MNKIRSVRDRNRLKSLSAKLARLRGGIMTKGDIVRFPGGKKGKGNPNHDSKTGEFTSGSGGGGTVQSKPAATDFDQALFEQILQRDSKGKKEASIAQIASAFWRVSPELRTAIEQQAPHKMLEAEYEVMRVYAPALAETLKDKGWKIT